MQDYAKNYAYAEYVRSRKLYDYNSSYPARKHFAALNLKKVKALEAMYPDFKEVYEKEES